MTKTAFVRRVVLGGLLALAVNVMLYTPVVQARE